MSVRNLAQIAFDFSHQESSLTLVKPTPKRKVARIPLHSDHRISFRSDSLVRPLDLADISVSGAALVHEGAAWTPKDRIEGIVGIDGRCFDVELEVRHHGQHLTGAEFIGADYQMKRAIECYLRMEMLALGLRRNGDAKSDEILLADGRGNEIRVLRSGDGIAEFELSFLGHYVGYRNGHLRVGRRVRDSAVTLVSMGQTLNALDLAINFVRSALALSERERGQIEARLKL
jgi:hypothetical protein